MKKVVILAALMMGWTQVASAQLVGDAERGAELVATCAACHGADGNSPAPAFPKLAGLGEKYLLKQMQDIRDGARPVPTMVGQVDGKTDQELADMAAFYDSQVRSGAQADPALVELGERVYRAGIAERNVAACTACHSPNGKGNAPAGFPGLAGQHADYIAAQLKAYRKGYQDESGRTNDGDIMIMRSNAFGLSDMEIEAVASYASGLK